MHIVSNAPNVAERHDNLLISVSPMLIPVAALGTLATLQIGNAKIKLVLLSMIVVLSIIVISFFRNPEIDTGGYAKLDIGDMVSPADGEVWKIDKVPIDQVRRDYGALVAGAYPREQSSLGEAGSADSTKSGAPHWTRIVIVLTVFDKHVQAMPCRGVIESATNHAGALWPILGGLKSVMEKTDRNERMVFAMRAATGAEFFVVLLAGLCASKIVVFDDADSSTLMGPVVRPRGYKFGMIKFGSRVDLIIPPSYNVAVKVGQKVELGRTLMALAPTPAV